MADSCVYNGSRQEVAGLVLIGGLGGEETHIMLAWQVSDSSITEAGLTLLAQTTKVIWLQKATQPCSSSCCVQNLLLDDNLGRTRRRLREWLAALGCKE